MLTKDRQVISIDLTDLDCQEEWEEPKGRATEDGARRAEDFVSWMGMTASNQLFVALDL